MTVRSIAGVDLTVADDSPKYAIGALHDGPGGRYQYGQADEAIDQGEACFYTYADGGLTLADTTEASSTPKSLGVAQADIASGKWGWIWRGEGQTEARVANGVSANSQLTTTDTGGELGTGGDAVAGTRNIDAGASSGLQTIEAATLMYAGAA